MLHRRLDIQARHVRAYLGAALEAGMTADDAARRYSALLCPELYHLLTVECGWSPQQYREWVIDLLDRDLLARPTRGRGITRPTDYQPSPHEIKS